MTLLVNERQSWRGQPGYHALIVGVSAYSSLPRANEPLTPHSFGMKQLSSTALTAYKIYRWLVMQRNNLPVPLVTCRLLLSPSVAELEAEPEIRDLTASGTLDNFLIAAKNWRADARTHSDNHTFFYFAGHGIRGIKKDTVMLLEDFGNGIGGTLKNTVDMHSIFYGMAPSPTQRTIARTQWYFVDACRNFPSKFRNFEQMNTTDVFDLELSGRDDRSAPIFYAAVPGSKAYGLRGEQTVFSKALLDCLRYAVADPLAQNDEGNQKWPVTIYSLNKALINHFSKMSREEKADQEFLLSGHLKDAVLYFLDSPPLV